MVDLPQLQIALNRIPIRARKLLDVDELSIAMQDFLEEFLRGRFPDRFVAVESRSALDDQDVLTTTGTAAFRPTVPDDFSNALNLYFEFFGKQELEEDLGEYGVASVAGIQMDGVQIESRGGQTPNGATGSDGSNQSRNRKDPNIAGIIIGVAVACVALCVLVSFFAFRGRRRTRELDDDEEETAALAAKETKEVDEEEDSPRKIDAAEAESEDDDKGSSQFPKPVYIRPYAEKSEEDPSEYTSDGDIVSIGSSQVTPRKPPVRNTPSAGVPNIADPTDVAKSGKESLRSYQYDASRLDQVISKTKQGKK